MRGVRRSILIALLAGSLFLLVTAPATGAGEVIHVVQWGENLTLVASSYGTTVQALSEVNGLDDPDFIWVGQRLVISGGGSAPAPSGGSAYIVQAGDFLSSIAWRHGVALAELVRANSISNPDLIYVGQQLVIPEGGGGSATAPAGDHVVAEGETLSEIAAQYGTTVWAIAVANSIANPSLIYVGQRLAIPGVESDPGATPGPSMTPLPTLTSMPEAMHTPTATLVPVSPTPTLTPIPSPSYQYRLDGDPVGEANAGVTQIRGNIWDVEGNAANGAQVRVWTPDGGYDDISFPSGPEGGYPEGGYDMLLDSRAKDGHWLVAVCDREGALLSAPVKVQTYADGPSVIYIDWRKLY